MNQAQQMNEVLGQKTEAKGLSKFVGKLEEIENDLNSAIGGFGAVGKAVAKAQKVSGKQVQANVDRAIKMMRDAEKIVQGLRLSLSGQAGESLGEAGLNKPLMLDIKKYLLGNMKKFDHDNLISKLVRETGDKLPKPIALLKKTWDLGNMKNKEDFISRLMSILDQAGKLDDEGIQRLLNRE